MSTDPPQRSLLQQTDAGIPTATPDAVTPTPTAVGEDVPDAVQIGAEDVPVATVARDVKRSRKSKKTNSEVAECCHQYQLFIAFSSIIITIYTLCKAFLTFSPTPSAAQDFFDAKFESISSAIALCLCAVTAAFSTHMLVVVNETPRANSI